jgi:hypothetical protein
MRLPHLLLVVTTSFVMVGVNGCRPSSANQEKLSNIKVEPNLQKTEELLTVMFDLKPSSDLPASAHSQLYDCTYQARGKSAKFRLQFGQKGLISDDPPVASGEGKFLAVKGSDNSALLEDLKKALDATRVPTNSQRIAELAFDAVILGQKQSRSPDGSFSENPPGDWITIKLFLPKGKGNEGEVFLNLNPALGKGEFSIKDSDYGDYLLKEFAKVL